MLPLPITTMPRSRSGARAAPSWRWWSIGFEASTDSWITGMSAAGKAWTSTDQVPWSRPQLSWSSPTHIGLTASATSSATSGEPGAGYSTANSSSGNP